MRNKANFNFGKMRNFALRWETARLPVALCVASSPHDSPRIRRIVRGTCNRGKMWLVCSMLALILPGNSARNRFLVPVHPDPNWARQQAALRAPGGSAPRVRGAKPIRSTGRCLVATKFPLYPKRSRRKCGNWRRRERNY